MGGAVMFALPVNSNEVGEEKGTKTGTAGFKG